MTTTLQAEPRKSYPRSSSLCLASVSSASVNSELTAQAVPALPRRGPAGLLPKDEQTPTKDYCHLAAALLLTGRLFDHHSEKVFGIVAELGCLPVDPHHLYMEPFICHHTTLTSLQFTEHQNQEQ